jgi:hypothetical protein
VYGASPRQNLGALVERDIPPRSNTKQTTMTRRLRLKVERGIAARRIAGSGRTPNR